MNFNSKSTASPASNRGSATRRDFLKTSFATSVAATAFRTAESGVNAFGVLDSQVAQRSVITVTNAVSHAALRKPWKTTIATGHAYLILRADLQGHLEMLQRIIGYRPGRRSVRCLILTMPPCIG